jgi:hypothetical protein
MPVLKILNDDDRLLPGNWAGVLILSTMLYPSDEKRRDAYIAAVLQESIRAQDSKSAIPAEIAGLTFDFGGGPGIEKDAHNRLSHGLVAGETLNCLLQIAEFAPQHASLRQAQFIVKKVRIKQKFATRIPIPASATPIETAWGNFKSVAHLWAAFIPRWIELGDEEVLSDAMLPDFLAVARWLAEAGANLTPKRGREPVLDKGVIWMIPDSPDIPTVHLKPPRMSELELDLLRNYNSASRG